MINKIKKTIANKEKQNERDPLAELSTLDEKVEKIRKNTIKRLTFILLFLSVGMFVISGLVKFAMVMSNGEKRKDIKTKTEKIKLEVNTFSKWQEIKDQQIEQLGKDIKSVDVNLTKKIISVKKELKQDINITTNKILTKLNKTQEENNKFVTSMLDDIKKTIKNSEKNTKKYADERTLTIEKKIKDIKKRDLKRIADFTKLSLPKLPPFNKKLGTKDNNKSIQNNVSKKSNIKQTEDVIEVEEDVAIVEDSLLTELDNSDENNSKGEKKLPKFTISPGFTKGIIVTGAAVPTLSQGKNAPKPVWISLTGDTIIANDDRMFVDGCLLQATATGDFASGVAEIRLSKISCSITNSSGKKFQIFSKVKGWIYSENGQYGLKGRLVSKEGELIEKAIPLSAIEGLITALSNVGGSTTTIGGANNVATDFGQGAAAGGTKVLNKISDYYLKILEALNPVIEIKAGREVTIAFAGGEVLEFKKYLPANIYHFKGEDDE